MRRKRSEADVSAGSVAFVASTMGLESGMLSEKLARAVMSSGVSKTWLMEWASSQKEVGCCVTVSRVKQAGRLHRTYRCRPAHADFVSLARGELAEQIPGVETTWRGVGREGNGNVGAQDVGGRRKAGQAEVLEARANIWNGYGGRRNKDGLLDVGESSRKQNDEGRQ